MHFILSILSFAVIINADSRQQLELNLSKRGAVDYQIHSNNDLLEVRQSLLKDARRFKFDPHYVKSHPLCPNGGSCLLLNHDTPLPSVSTYNTSDDLLSYLISEEFLSLSRGDRVTVALCFKSAPDKCQESSAAFKDWVELVDDFHYKAVKSLPSNVEIILDGDAKPISCLVGKWKPWNSVWIVTDSPADAFYSNAIESDFYRFQVLNNPENESNWEWMAEEDVNYGKFANSSYPYQLWEPDAQADIQMYIDIYESGEEHPAGFHFAINTDVAMFEIFSASNRSTNHRQPHSKSRKVSEGNEMPALLQVSNGLFVLSSIDRDTMDINLQILRGNTGTSFEFCSPIVLPDDVSLYLMTEGKERITPILLTDDVENEISLLLVSESGRLASIRIDTLHNTLSQEAKSVRGSLETLNEKIFDVRLINDGCIGDSYFCLLALSSSYLGVLHITVYSVSSTGRVLSPSTRNEIRIASALPGLPVDSARVVVAEPSTLLIFASTNGSIHAAKIELKEGLHLNGRLMHSLSEWRLIAVGKNLDVSLSHSTTASEKDGLLLLVNDGGYCYNSHSHNTRSVPTVCSSEPRPTRTVLDYSLGLVSDWLALFITPDRGSSECFAVSSCSSNILHGSYDQGTNPSAVIGTIEGGQHLFVEIHEGLTSDDSVEANLNGCGLPLLHDGLVMDSFSIEQWIRNLRLLASD